MTLSEKQCEFTAMVGKLIQEATRIGLGIKVVEWNRDMDTQKKYVASGKSKTLSSKHLELLAVDIAVFRNRQLREDREALLPLGEYWEGLGGTWGGRFGENLEVIPPRYGWDSCHFEYKCAI